MTNDPLPLATRIWFAWLCFFRILFDAEFAGRVWGAREHPRLPAASPPSDPVVAAPAPPAAPMAPPPPTPVAKAPTPVTAALQLLALFQREGRLVDFLQQDIASFPDADIGVAARVVHEGCRRALRAHATIDPIRAESEGARVVLPVGFGTEENKLVGDVKGPPPYAGVLRHRGWRATRFVLPEIVGAYDARILTPAEVELG